MAKAPVIREDGTSVTIKRRGGPTWEDIRAALDRVLKDRAIRDDDHVTDVLITTSRGGTDVHTISIKIETE